MKTIKTYLLGLLTCFLAGVLIVIEPYYVGKLMDSNIGHPFLAWALGGSTQLVLFFIMTFPYHLGNYVINEIREIKRQK